MRKWRLSDEPLAEDEDEKYRSPEIRSETKCNIFLGYTSNLISSGLREVILFLVKHKHVAAVVTTAGGIEEDLIKCLGNTYLADFNLDGADLRRRGMNRIGNLIIPNDNYCKFEDWLTPILDAMLAEQKETGEVWTPRRFIHRLGKEINNEESVYYWAYKNDIPVFCPALTDGSIGDMIYFHSFKNPGLVLDIVQDIRELNEKSRKSRKAGMIVLGGGVCKHQIANAMLIRNGADYSVFINTGQEFDGSDSGARPDEAVSWGKIRAGAEAVKVFADATLVFPMLVAATFAKDYQTS
ncbi:Deoxyhypusine synthase [Lentinula edodes]|uniref:deoxyhypusine synthase n=2 Tax=Lentinula edodes TaxID=5353 RepID=A0A1Q3EDS5_LENED|nr:Deoxyhypusine synthase [Lentinula edodes]